MGEIYRDSVRGGVVWIGDRDSEVGISQGSGVPSSGISGTGAGSLGKGSLYVNRATGVLYSNMGTKASPTWIEVGLSS